MPLPPNSGAPASHFADLASSLAAACACSSRRATTPRNEPSRTTSTTPGMALMAARSAESETRGIGRRPRHGAEQHVRGPQIVDEHLLAEHLGGNVDARIGGADDLLLGRALALGRHIHRARQRDLAGGLAIAHALAGGARHLRRPRP